MSRPFRHAAVSHRKKDKSAIIILIVDKLKNNSCLSKPFSLTECVVRFRSQSFPKSGQRRKEKGRQEWKRAEKKGKWPRNYKRNGAEKSAEESSKIKVHRKEDLVCLVLNPTHGYAMMQLEP